MIVICLLVCFLACTGGAICGIGGGVVIKPVLDACQIAGTKTVSFLSGCTVLCMTAYSVTTRLIRGGNEMDTASGTPIAIGAALGGLSGKLIFKLATSAYSSSAVTGIQSAVLFFLTIGTFVFTIYKKKIRTHEVSGFLNCLMIGLLLGLFSSFLGIGGGPINLVVLTFFFSMETKKAAATSLYIILFSQTASLIYSILSGTVPEFNLFLLLGMSACGILGGMAGKKINKRIGSDTVDKLFAGMNIVVILICFFNIVRASA